MSRARALRGLWAAAPLDTEVQSREARFVADTMAKYPLHDYHRLAPLLHRLRAVKPEEQEPVHLLTKLELPRAHRS